MKNESQSSRGPVFYLATENLGFSLFRRYRIQEKMMEGKNFVPEAMMIHSFQKEPYHDRNGVGFRGEVRMPELELMTGDVIGPAYLPEFDGMIPFVRFQDEGDKDDKDDKDDWDEDEEDWDEDEDEDWDEDEEDWDEDEDEDWDEDEEDWDEDDSQKE